MRELIDTATKLGSVETEGGAEAGKAFVELRNTAGEALDGIEKNLSGPILDALETRAPEIIELITDETGQLIGTIDTMFAIINGPQGDGIGKIIDASVGGLRIVGNTLNDILQDFNLVIAAGEHFLNVVEHLPLLGGYVSAAVDVLEAVGNGGKPPAAVTMNNTFQIPQFDSHTTSQTIAKALLPQLQKASKGQQANARAMQIGQALGEKIR